MSYITILLLLITLSDTAYAISAKEARTLTNQSVVYHKEERYNKAIEYIDISIESSIMVEKYETRCTLFENLLTEDQISRVIAKFKKLGYKIEYKDSTFSLEW